MKDLGGSFRLLDSSKSSVDVQFFGSLEHLDPPFFFFFSLGFFKSLSRLLSFWYLEGFGWQFLLLDPLKVSTDIEFFGSLEDLGFT